MFRHSEAAHHNSPNWRLKLLVFCPTDPKMFVWDTGSQISDLTTSRMHFRLFISALRLRTWMKQEVHSLYKIWGDLLFFLDGRIRTGPKPRGPACRMWVLCVLRENRGCPSPSHGPSVQVQFRFQPLYRRLTAHQTSREPFALLLMYVQYWEQTEWVSMSNLDQPRHPTGP